MNYTHQTAETKFAEANGIKFAYRRFGRKSGTPVIFLQHFTGTMDNWDPLVTDGVAQNHEVILFDNTGIGSSTGNTPDNVAAMADDALAFIEALSTQTDGFTQVDLLGFSIGGFIAQKVAAKKPALVRKLILAGTGPQGSIGMDKLPGTFSKALTMAPDDRYVWMFFTESESSKKSGYEVWARRMLRTEGRDTETAKEAVGQQLKALVGWGVGDKSYADLKAITQPALVFNGSNDRIVATPNSYTLYEQLSNARLLMVPDSGHGALFQYADLFVAEITGFLK